MVDKKIKNFITTYNLKTWGENKNNIYSGAWSVPYPNQNLDIKKNEEKFDLKYQKFGDFKEQLETKLANIDGQDLEVQSLAKDTLQNKQKEVASKQKNLGSLKNSKAIKPANHSR